MELCGGVKMVDCIHTYAHASFCISHVAFIDLMARYDRYDGTFMVKAY